jgi:hypothetical protein
MSSPRRGSAPARVSPTRVSSGSTRKRMSV